MSIFRLLMMGVLFVAVSHAHAAAVTWEGLSIETLDIPTVEIPSVQLESLPISTGSIPVVVLRTLDVEIQARSIGLLLDRWMKLYGLLDRPTLYKGNRFAVRAEVIKRRALKEGVSDAVLAQCAEFSAALQKVRNQR